MNQRNVILEGVHNMFTRFGVKSITMDDIASKLTMSKKTIYQYFKDKDSLVIEYVKNFLQEQENEINEINKKSSNVIEEMVLCSDYLKKVVANINPTVLFDLRKYHPTAYGIFVKHKEDFTIGYLRDTLRKGIKDGFFRKDINVEILAKMRIEQIEQGYNPDFFPVDKFNPAEVQLQIFEHFMYGICTLKGHETIYKYRPINE